MSDQTQQFALTPTEAGQLEEILADLRACGYVDIEQHSKLRVGARVRHSGHRWTDALLNGTGVVVALTERPNSPWAQSWHMADIELVALWDKPGPLESRLSQLAQYHVAVIEHGQVARIGQ